MNVTRYFQSCVIIEENGVRLLIDASGEELARIESFGRIDAVLFTHEHSDHFSPAIAEKYMQIGVPVYANASTAKLMKTQPNIISDNQELSVGALKIVARELPHCLLFNGSVGPQNTGYLINNRIFHSGDSAQPSDIRADIAIIPMVGPDVSFKDSIAFAGSLAAKTVIPIHYDYLGGKPEVFANYLQKVVGARTVILEQGATAEIV